MRNLVFLLLFSSLLTAMDYFPKSTSLDGKWSYYVESMPQGHTHTYNFQGNEPTMELPANWFKHGVNHGGVVWFERTIDTDDLPKASKHFLKFTGVDYLCDVWINEKFVGSHEGYFQHFDFDISSFLQKGKNVIKVKVNSPLENYPENYSLNKTLLRGIFAHHDTRPGGAWSAEGQDKNSGGIWNHIFIESYSTHKFTNLEVTPRLETDNVRVSIEFLLQELKNDSKASFLYYRGGNVGDDKLKVSVTPSNFEGESYNYAFKLPRDGGEQQLEIDLPRAKIWSTYDRGFPHLYTLKLSYGNTEIQEQVGFKSLTQKEDGTYLLNGEPYYIKGTNYISSQYMSEMDEAALKKDLKLMMDAHINTVRVHAHIEPKRFYRLCDEMGMLVWQDYNLQWGYIDSEEFKLEAVKQAKEMVDELYNHPSIFIWSMHNEPPWDSDWMKWKYPNYDKTQNKELDDVLYNTIKRYDPSRLCQKFSSNLEHPWFGWYSGKYQDFANPSKVPVITEYGAQAIPNYENLKKFIPKKYLLPKSKKAKKKWEYHNYQFNWSEKNGVKFGKSLKKLINDSQTYQADLIKFATEMLRIQKYNGTTAIFQFMFNEGWPSMNWGIIDYYRTPKPGYFALKETFAPIIVVAKQNDEGNLELYVVNDTMQKIENAQLNVTARSSEDERVLKYDVQIEPDSVLQVSVLPISGTTELKMSLETDKQLAYNAYSFNAEKASDPIVILAKQTKENTLELSIENNTPNPIENAELHGTLKTKMSTNVYKWDAKKIDANSVQKIATLPLSGKTDVSLSLETDVQLDYKHHVFDVKQKEGDDK